MLTLLVVMLSIDAPSLAWTLLSSIGWLREAWSPGSRRGDDDAVRPFGVVDQDPAQVDGVR